MKYIRTYEGFKPPGPNDPSEGDYVILKNEVNFIEDRIGKIIVDLSSDMANFRTYKVEFDDKTFDVWDSEILFHSKSREECDVFLNAKKYNV